MRPVLCLTEHEHRDRALAEAVVEGRFTHAGETRAMGQAPDWLTRDLPADEEWRIDWVKFYYGLDLAHAFRATGDRRFPDAWERLVGSFIARVPADHDPSEVTARRILNWIYAAQRMPVRLELEDSLRAQAAHVRATLSPERNHRTLELYALLIAGLALADRPLRDFAVRALQENLLTDFRPDGVHREASTHYHMIALRSMVGARANAGPISPAFDERLLAACDFARAIQRPDGTIPALSDGDTGDYRPLLALAARLLGRADLLVPGGGDFADGGYFVRRAGERYLVFDCGPLGDGGHGHYDALSIEAWNGDAPLVLDPGRFTYAEPERRWFRSTAAHNTVVVDGLDQTPYARGRSGAPCAQATWHGDLEGEVTSPVYDAIHRRRVTPRADGWLVVDELSGGPHQYDLRWHLPPGEASVSGDTVRGDGVTLAIRGATGIALERGWIAPRYGERIEAPVVSAIVHGERARFETVIAP
jgi:uncharacterized heparinase superfamily protein